MSATSWTDDGTRADRGVTPALAGRSRRWRRGALLAVLVVGAASAFHATGAAETAAATAREGADLTRLLRFMALMKAAMAMAALGAVWWRLAAPATAVRLAAYLAAGGAMAAGPVLIWGMVHVGLGALLLHGGLFAALLVLWRDPAVTARLGAMVAARRLAP